jgi:hypothetical protein
VAVPAWVVVATAVVVVALIAGDLYYRSHRAKPLTDFLELWKDADADIPILKQAKAEYAKLQ